MNMDTQYQSHELRRIIFGDQTYSQNTEWNLRYEKEKNNQVKHQNIPISLNNFEKCTMY